MAQTIDDKWFENDSFITWKLPIPITYTVASAEGVVTTLEGDVQLKQGHIIITGSTGEQYPVMPESFAEKYDLAAVDSTTGTGKHSATPKNIIKKAKLADHDGVVHLPWGVLKYSAGEEFIVRHGPDDYGPVRKDIFFLTYDTSSYKP